ncbi:HU family DNA-binding protein [Vibrio parahaemolyticus]|uniref:HU family DNA-binding protein n=1 Tax=Vibrio parahaemolyticus TaxID=670 RepID=UPI0015DFC61D|nr:HU family DNA-binding protein [Vibrio parahaemolyticus]MBE3985611.1 HU family DNA-binding protein [Vibrio parahaemolyticus]MBE4286387.1 HU family DNA-binding protein [Vibrio parahaemolyticus]MDF4902169.1 HU family DNA-binding protein [Vibrio parahaemolyticus]HCG7330428.1 HU family DNA-binding protein [Vibrio parahaemolyticus]HCG8859890.1 HU family DNA-binding protein [Vibrio parahaemolyticus]
MKVNRTELELLITEKLKEKGVDLGVGLDESDLVRDGLDALVNTYLEALSDGREVRLNEFGRMRVSPRERATRNPLTGERLGISIENYVIFTPSEKVVIVHDS